MPNNAQQESKRRLVNVSLVIEKVVIIVKFNRSWVAKR
jgi:hypothetical protein